ncbi:borealin-like [Mya arenaria]|uniref:borealin-like n=1 Tax=Mya arenaria TaxID=6604 RepID=UPI0022E3225F|nr:borealin-like [Mya arenaria]
MPRKRNTTAPTKHAKPVLSASHEDDLINGMSQKQSEDKMKGILNDFRLNVEQCKQEYEEESEAVKKAINKHYTQIMLKLSPRELQMTLLEYIEYTDQEGEEEPTAVPSQPPVSVPSSLQTSKDALSKYKTMRLIDTIPEEGQTAGTSAVKRTTRKRATNKAKGVTFNPNAMPDPSNSFVTPALAGSRNMSVLGWGATPMVTPKFDPRLPVTPAMKRQMQPDETLMSMAGSPVDPGRRTTVVAADGDKVNITVPESMHIGELQEFMSMLGKIIKNKDNP